MGVLREKQKKGSGTGSGLVFSRFLCEKCRMAVFYE